MDDQGHSHRESGCLHFMLSPSLTSVCAHARAHVCSPRLGGLPSVHVWRLCPSFTLFGCLFLCSFISVPPSQSHFQFCPCLCPRLSVHSP